MSNLAPVAPPTANPVGTQSARAPDISGAVVQNRFSSAEASGLPEATKTTLAPAQKIDRESVEEATKKIKDFIHQSNNAIEFSITDDTNQFVVKVIDRVTKEVIKQFPSEEVIQIARSLDRLQGLLVKQQV